MAETEQVGSLRRANVRLDVYSVTDKEGRKAYRVSLPKVFYRGNSGASSTAKSLDRLQIPTVIELLKEAEQKLSDLEKQEPVWVENEEGPETKSQSFE